MNILSGESYLDICIETSKHKGYIEDYQLIYRIGVLYDLYNIASEDIKGTIKVSLDTEIEKINTLTIKKLLETAFLFAALDYDNIEYNFYNSKEELIEQIDYLKNQAYRIAISIYYYGKYLKELGKEGEGFFSNNNIIYRLFTRLGILTKARDEKLEDIDIFSLDLHGKIEATNKELNNRFSIKDELQKGFKDNQNFINTGSFKSDEVYFSDFQSKIIKELIGYKTLGGGNISYSTIISAPTSAGKTFIIKKYIIYKIWENYLLGNKINIVFIVPSKALINELKNDFLQLFKEYNINEDICNIHSYISGNDFLENYSIGSNLFIFTQERLNYFYNDVKSKGKIVKFNILIADEAHKVSYGYRGILLKYIISKIKDENNKLQIILLAPLIKKLHKLKDEFGLKELTENFSNFSLVAKNEIFVESKKIGSRYHLIFFLRNFENEFELFRLQTSNDKVNSQSKFLTYLLNKFSKNSQSIIFRYGPKRVQRQAESILQDTINDYQKTQTHLSNYITDVLPDNFPLRNYLEHGIAYHNGALPLLIKSNIETLFKEGNIKYLCANSTILEGVNLPAKNIFIGGDGKEEYISKLDFMNLLGRSGRLNHHLNGNIFFTEFNKYEEKLPNEKTNTQEFELNVINVLNDNQETEKEGKTKFDRFLNYIRPGSTQYKELILISDKEERKDFEYMFGYLVSKTIDENIKELSSIDKQETLISIQELLNKRFKTNSFMNKEDDIFSKLGTFIYENKEIKEYKIEEMRNSILTYSNELNLITKGDIEFLKVVQKNIFIDPRKQLDFYDLVSNGNDLFIKNNITKYAEALKLLTNYKKVGIELIEGKDYQYEKIIMENEENLRNIYNEVKRFFMGKYLYGEEEKYSNKSEGYYEGLFKILKEWVFSKPLKKILGNNADKYFKRLNTISKEIQFDCLNAFSIYFELANLGYKKYIQQYDPEKMEYNLNKLDTNFIYYMELGTFYPTLVYLISKGVSRETAIWLWKQGNLKLTLFHENPKNYFVKNKLNIINYLESHNKQLVKEELEKFIY